MNEEERIDIQIRKILESKDDKNFNEVEETRKLLLMVLQLFGNPEQDNFYTKLEDRTYDKPSIHDLLKLNVFESFLGVTNQHTDYHYVDIGRVVELYNNFRLLRYYEENYMDREQLLERCSSFHVHLEDWVQTMKSDKIPTKAIGWKLIGEFDEIHQLIKQGGNK